MKNLNVKEEVFKIHKKYSGKHNDIITRNKMRAEIKDKFFDKIWLGEIIDKTTPDMIDKQKYLFKIKIFGKEFTLEEYADICNNPLKYA